MIKVAKLKHDNASELLAVLRSMAFDDSFLGDSVGSFEQAANELWRDIEFTRSDCAKRGVPYKEPHCLHRTDIDLVGGGHVQIVADHLAMEVRVKSYAMDEAA
jgi:hypothetical protein